MTEFSQEDAKLVTLAKAARGRVQAAEGAALRDTTGRTYASANVDLPTLKLGAVHIVLAQAFASGATGIEAVVICGDSSHGREEVAALVWSMPSANSPVHFVSPDGELIETFIA